MSKSLSRLSNSNDTSSFAGLLSAYKRDIDADIDAYSSQLLTTTNEQFGEYSFEAISAYCSVLARGGKRIRGALTMHAYYAFGGTDEAVAIRAARAIEMLQAYILIMDDIMDRSNTRRGGPTAHVMLKDYHENNHFMDNSLHFGESIAMNAALFGCHAAMLEVGELPVSAETKIIAINIMNRMLMVTAHGQIHDVFNEVVAETSDEDVERVLVWKTAYYTFVNPLQFGAALVGVKDERFETITEYSLCAGRAFQIADDILGTFGDEFDSGKSPLDDIKEGKRTLLVVKALNIAPKSDAYFLRKCLGSQDLNIADFHRCQEIIRETGALKIVRAEAEKSAAEALVVLNKGDLPDSLVSFLSDLVQYVVVRKS